MHVSWLWNVDLLALYMYMYEHTCMLWWGIKFLNQPFKLIYKIDSGNNKNNCVFFYNVNLTNFIVFNCVFHEMQTSTKPNDRQILSMHVYLCIHEDRKWESQSIVWVINTVTHMHILNTLTHTYSNITPDWFSFKNVFYKYTYTHTHTHARTRTLFH